MQVSNTSSSSSTSGTATGSSDIAALQKQLRDLTNELKNVATSNLDAKAKAEKTKLLQAQIQMVQAQIAAIQRANMQKQQTAQSEQMTSVKPVGDKSKSNGGRRVKSLGVHVDTFA